MVKNEQKKAAPPAPPAGGGGRVKAPQPTRPAQVARPAAVQSPLDRLRGVLHLSRGVAENVVIDEAATRLEGLMATQPATAFPARR